MTTSGPPLRATEEQIAAAQLRRVLDEKLGRQTPEVVERIAASSRAVPEAAVGRLAVYLRVLTSMIEQGVTTMSSEELAGAAGVNSATLRKDLSYVGSYGTRGVGYDTAKLAQHIEQLLGLTRHHSVAVVGIGNLGHALATYGGFPDRGFPVIALFDLHEDLIGVPIGGVPVDHVDTIPTVCAEREVTIGVICTPASAAQGVCDLLVAGGVGCILNFAPVVLQVPAEVEVRRVDLAVELQILSFYQARHVGRAQRQHRSPDPAVPVPDLQSQAVPEAAVGRLAIYLRVLTSMIEQGVVTMSGEELAVAAGVNSAAVRKDLSYMGSFGTRGVGYDTAQLVYRIERLLGLARHHSVAVVGIGHLGHALANYGGFVDRGFPVTALFDLDEDLIGVPIGGVPVDHVDTIPTVCAEREVTIGVICTPASAAQGVCNLLIAGGVRCILNFAPVVLQVPADVEVRRVDLAVDLQILSFYQTRHFGRAEAQTAEVNIPVTSDQQ